jgi:hypothetical protein
MEGYMKLDLGLLRIGAELWPLSSSTAFTSTWVAQGMGTVRTDIASNRTKISKSMTASGRFELQFKEICSGKHWRFTAN